jgi:hypothetical protein
LEAKDKRIRQLEYVLEQRYRETKRQFDPDKLEEMKGKVYQIFLANPGVGFTYEEAEDDFERTYGFRSANVGQRMRDLRQEDKLWSTEETIECSTKKKVRFYLKLAEVTVTSGV